MLSLNARSLIAATVMLTAFLGLTGLTLDRAFRDSAEEAVRERLKAHLYGLLAIAELDADGNMLVPDMLPEERFTRPGSGLYAQVSDERGQAHWLSRSQLGQGLPLLKGMGQGEWRFGHVVTEHGVELYALSFGVAWEDETTANRNFTFSVAEALDYYLNQVSRFRRGLWGWLAAVALLLLVAQIGILRWGLAPLRRVEHDLGGIEAGKQERLEGVYPRELRGLTNNLNSLLRTERRQMERYRDALADLAHSLKTPLAVLRGACNRQAGDDGLAPLVREQGKRMEQIVEYQLQRAATSGRTALMGAVAIAPLVNRIVDSLAKVYAAKPVNCTIEIDSSLRFSGDEGDLMELFGNLLDNAFKWCDCRVRVQARRETGAPDQPGQLVVVVEDDGQGAPRDEVDRILKRGERADITITGHGIGLAVVQEIVSAYQGTLGIAAAPLGGASVQVRLSCSPE